MQHRQAWAKRETQPLQNINAYNYIMLRAQSAQSTPQYVRHLVTVTKPKRQ